MTHHALVQMDMPVLQNGDERDYGVMLISFICNHINGYRRSAEVLSFCLLGAPYDGL